MQVLSRPKEATTLAKKKPKFSEASLKRARLASRAGQAAGLYVLLLFIVLPLAFGPLLYGDITEVKRYTFYVLAALLGVSLLFLVLFELPLHPAKPLTLKSVLAAVRPYEWALIAYLLFLIVSTITSVAPLVSLVGTNARGESTLLQIAYVGTALALGRLYRPKERDLMVFCGVAALVAAYGLCQYYGFDFIGFFPEGYDHAEGPGMYFYSTMSNVNLAAAYLGLAFCLAFVGFSRWQKPLHWVYLPVGMLLFYALLITRTASAYLGCAVALVLCFALVVTNRRAAARAMLLLAGCVAALWLNIAVHRPEWPTNKYLAAKPLLLPALLVLLAAAAVLWFWPFARPRLSQKAWRAGWAVFLLVCVILVVVFAPVLAQATGSETLMEMAAVLRGRVEDDFGTGRVGVWRQTLAMLTPGRLLFGHGPDMFGTMYLYTYSDGVLTTDTEILDKVHNEYLQWLFEDGLLALLALLAAFGLIFWRARRALQRPQVLAVFVALVFYLVQAFFNIATPFTHPLVWALWGILAASGTASGREEKGLDVRASLR